jgi:alanyl-tRNA synthetase
LGKLKLYSKLLLVQLKTKFKKAKEYEVPRCGVSFTKMTRLADEVKGIKIVKEQDTKATTFRISAKAPEIVFGYVSQMAELVVPNIDSPSKKDQKKLSELGAYIRKLQPLMKDIELYKEASAQYNS